MSTETIKGFEIINGKVAAESDDDVDEIRKIFPKGTIISTQHNHSQLSNNKYFEDYYIVGNNGRVQGTSFLFDDNIKKSKKALKLDTRRERSRSRSRDRSRDRSSRSRSRGGKRKTMKKSK